MESELKVHLRSFLGGFFSSCRFYCRFYTMKCNRISHDMVCKFLLPLFRNKKQNWILGGYRRCLFRQVTSRDLITRYAKLGLKSKCAPFWVRPSRIIIVPKTSIKDIQSNLIKNTLKVLNELLNFELTWVQKRPLPGYSFNHSVKITKSSL